MRLVATVTVLAASEDPELLRASFIGGGPATLTFGWHPEFGFGGSGWVFESGFGQIEPTPEPASVLLFGSTMAALGLAAWRPSCGKARGALASTSKPVTS